MHFCDKMLWGLNGFVSIQVRKHFHYNLWLVIGSRSPIVKQVLEMQRLPKRIENLRQKSMRSPTLRQRYLKYTEGYLRGQTDAESIYRPDISFRKIAELIQSQGKVTLRRKSYPMVIIRLSLKDTDIYYIRPIYEKIPWTRFLSWASNRPELYFVWEGYNAQILLSKCKQYLPDDLMSVIKKALRWIPMKGVEIPENEMRELLNDNPAYPVSNL